MEADPGTFDAERLRQYMSLGLSRFSVGVQAFQEVGPLTQCPAQYLFPVLTDIPIWSQTLLSIGLARALRALP